MQMLLKQKKLKCAQQGTQYLQYPSLQLNTKLFSVA